MPSRLRIAALRSEDLLVLEFEFINLEPAAGGILERVTPGEPALIVVKFCPQHIMEAAFTNMGPVSSETRMPIPAEMAGGSRLVFRLPDNISQLPLTLEDLLHWERWQQVLASGPPNELETAIEFPWRLIISPIPEGTTRWSHRIGPVTLDGKTQLWHTDLVHDTSLESGGNFRALHFVPGDPLFTLNNNPNMAPSLRWKHREELVYLTKPENLPDARPIKAESLSLSTLGASARLQGEWPLTQDSPNGRPSLTKYEHVASQGRDHFVITVKVGFLSTGHRASIVTTTERAPVTTGVAGHVEGRAIFGTAAFLRQRMEVIVEEPQIDYGPMAEAYSFGGREMPLCSISLVTRSAQVLIPDSGTIPESGPFDQPTWLLTPEGNPLFFKAIAVDCSNNQISFQLPLMFVPLEKVGDITQILCTYYNPPFGLGKATRFELNGQTLAIASDKGKPGSTHVKAKEIQFGLATVGAGFAPCPPRGLIVGSPLFTLEANKLPSSYRPRHLPYIGSVNASLPALDNLLDSKDAHELEYDLNYLENGFDTVTNPGQTFVQLKDELPIDFPSQQGGGLVRPNTVVKALSRTLGAVSDPEALKQKKIDLSAFDKARFLGTIPLLDIINVDPVNHIMSFDAASAQSELPTKEELDQRSFHLNQPRLITRRLSGERDGVETRFLWKPELKHNLNRGPLILELEGADLLLDAITTRSPSEKGNSVVIGKLRGAGFKFDNAISVTFGELLFRAEEGRKMEVSAKKVSLTFLGPLQFVNSLQSILPECGFEDPPFLTVDGQGVVAGYTLGVPNIGVGIFSLQNIALTTALSVPFVDKPAGVRFAISERHKPFLVTVSLFGGSGFFALSVSANGLEQIEAAIEFGGNISLNLIIASGGVYVMAGIYFALTANSVTLSGYLRCGGYLEVLGLISVSVEFYLALTYHKKEQGGSEVWGQASLKVCVKVAFFSKSVSLSVERRFAGSDGDPSFTEMMAPTEWAEYLQAFA